MSEYHNITAAEMDAFLRPQGFAVIKPDEFTKEIVYGKRIASASPLYSLCLRVYTGIVESGSREAGEDAIRVNLFGKLRDSGKIVKLAGAKRVHRVKGWKANLANRLSLFADGFTPAHMCDKCGLPMIERKRNQPGVTASSKRAFLGCVSFPICRNTRSL